MSIEGSYEEIRLEVILAKDDDFRNYLESLKKQHNVISWSLRYFPDLDEAKRCFNEITEYMKPDMSMIIDEVNEDTVDWNVLSVYYRPLK